MIDAAMTPTEIAAAFSNHEFDRTYEHLTEDVSWLHVGGDQEMGKAAVVAACTRSVQDLAGMTTTFTAFRTLTAGDAVAVVSTADYVQGDERSTVSSCDVYDFAGGKLAAITSFEVEV
jgi:ketosteroid isomerase-like protein